MTKSEGAPAPFGALLTDVERAKTRLRLMRSALTGYENDRKTHRTLLSLVIAAEAQAGLAWERFEEEYVRTHLPARFTPRGVASWNDALAQTAKALIDLRERVRAFRSRTTEFVLGTAA